SALDWIRPMASSRMSWAVGSLSRSRPETMAPAGLMKSWHSLPARRAARSAPSNGPEAEWAGTGSDEDVMASWYNGMVGANCRDLPLRQNRAVGYQPGVTNLLSRHLKSGALGDRLADIAEEAAALILPYWRAGGSVETKADDSPVTEADRAAERLILERLDALYPGVQTVAEEAACADGLPEAVESRFWLIDPLDGTRGFVRGGESFTVNIALIENGEPVAGVVTAPALSLSWRAGPGGAFRRRFGEAWQPIRVRRKPEAGMAVLSHSVTDAEAERLAARHGCATWQGTDSSIKFCF